MDEDKEGVGSREEKVVDDGTVTEFGGKDVKEGECEETNFGDNSRSLKVSEWINE